MLSMQRVNGLDLNLLVAFEALYRERSVTRAAQSLGLTQPAMSQKLRRLRDGLDDPLFVASTNGLVPTASAEALAPTVRQALSALEGALTEVAGFDPSTAERHFVLQMNDFSEIVVVPTALRRLTEAGPRLTLEVVPPSPQVGEQLERGQVDLAFGAGVPAPPSARTMRLGEHDFVVVARPDHPALRAGLTLDAYLAASHVVVAPRGGDDTFVDRALQAAGHRRNVGCRLRRFMTAPFLVAESDLLYTAPRSLLRVLKDRLPLVAYEAPFEIPSVTFSMFWHERVHHDPAHIWLRELAVKTNEELNT